MSDYEVRELFLLYYPTKDENIIDQIYIGDDEYMFYIDDGSRVRFDNEHHTFTYIRPRNESMNNDADEIWTKEFSRKLKRKLTMVRMTQRDFAREIGVTERTVHRYLKGSCVPEFLTLRKMARVLDCSIDELTNFDYLL